MSEIKTKDDIVLRVGQSWKSTNFSINPELAVEDSFDIKEIQGDAFLLSYGNAMIDGELVNGALQKWYKVGDFFNELIYCPVLSKG